MMAGINEEMLINLESPEKNINSVIHNNYLKNPLIPGPDLNCNELESNNPFDIVAQSAENWDPFELVLHQSLRHCGRNNEDSHIGNSDKLLDCEFAFVKDNNFRLNRSNSVSKNIKLFPTGDKQQDAFDSDLLNISSRSLDNSPSLREKIKRVVKKRVSKCIERALNGSTLSGNCKNEVLSPKKCTWTNSGDTGNFENIVPTLKKNETGYDLNNIFEEAKQLSVILHNMSLNDEAKISPSKNQKTSSLRAKKTLLAEPNVLSLEEDLMSVEPPWDGCEDSSDSDDNNIGLPKVKLFYVKKKIKEGKNEINQEKLAHYKKRIRASIDGNMSCEEDFSVDETITKCTKFNESKLEERKELHCNDQSIECEQPKEIKPLDFLVVNKPIVSGTNDLRLKKVGKILKKGPLKAIVPLQKMTKNIAEKMSPKKKSPPFSRTKGISNDEASLSSSLMHPVATSTPNSKNVSYQGKNVMTPPGSKARSRVSRKDSERILNPKRSVSLCSNTRKNSQCKQPFSSIDPNDNFKGRRPHTAPISSNVRLTKYSPKYEKNDLKKHGGNKLSLLDKENRLQT